MACGCRLPPEICCVDFGRLFEQLVWGSLLHRAGIEALAGSSSSSSSTSLVAAILKEMSRSIRPWRNRTDLGTEDWRNQVYMVRPPSSPPPLPPPSPAAAAAAVPLAQHCCCQQEQQKEQQPEQQQELRGIFCVSLVIDSPLISMVMMLGLWMLLLLLLSM